MRTKPNRTVPMYPLTIALALLAALLVGIGPSTAWAAAARLITGKNIKNGSVTGKDIKNRTLTGADIRDRSVLGAHIASGAITSARLAAAAATADKIAAGAITAEKLAAGAVGTSGLADGSVTAAKLASGAVPVYTAGNGLALDGTQFSAKASPDTKTVYVAKSGGEYTSIQAAIDSVTDASATNRYLVQVGPGVFEERVTVKEFVAVKGSGKDSTIIRSAGGASEAAAATVTMSYGAALSELTVDNTGGSQYSVSVLSPHNSYSYLRDVAMWGATSGTATYPLLLDGYASVYAWDLEVTSSSTLSPTNSGIRLQGAGPPTLYLNRSQVSMSDGTNVRALDIDTGGALVNHSLFSAINGTNAAGIRLGNNTSATVRWSEIEARSGSTSSAPVRSEGGTFTSISNELSTETSGATANLLMTANTTTAAFHGSLLSGGDNWIQADGVGSVSASASRLENGTSGLSIGLVTFACGASVDEAYGPLTLGCI